MDMLPLLPTALSAVALGFFPIIIWLAFWLIEDRRHPEPRQRLLVAFMAGMLSVPFVLGAQAGAYAFVTYGTLLLFIWATIEAIAKIFFAWFFVLRDSAVDEPIDIPVYLITVSLGFAALENTLFLVQPLMYEGFAISATTGGLRFIGPTLIHVLDAVIIGSALALAFFRSRGEKILYGLIGIILAAALHATFNILIIATDAEQSLSIFLGVWVAIIFALLMLERIKLLHPPAWWEKVFISSRDR
ncbi:PrsW family intramembrane metalloprotease [Patescibacteria group bacterium]|nr:PrsW family intramembrane metalloprotease [Patescibacteria group bacterium]